MLAQVWLWKLIADPDIARSRMLNNFLELTDAARMVTKCVSFSCTLGSGLCCVAGSWHAKLVLAGARMRRTFHTTRASKLGRLVDVMPSWQSSDALPGGTPPAGPGCLRPPAPPPATASAASRPAATASASRPRTGRARTPRKPARRPLTPPQVKMLQTSFSSGKCQTVRAVICGQWFSTICL